MQAVYSDIHDAGANLVALSPQLPEHSAKIVRRHKVEFAVLSDQGLQYSEQLGLPFTLSDELKEVYKGFGLDLPNFNGDDSWRLPLPARLIVDGDGIVRHVEANADYTDRPEPSEILGRLQGLAG